MNKQIAYCVVATLSLAGCAVPPATSTPASTVIDDSTPNGWAGRSAGKGRWFLRCGGEDPEVDFSAEMVGAGKNARVVDGVITYTSIYGFGEHEELSFPVRRPARYINDARCVGPEGTGGLWMSINRDLSFFILPAETGAVQVNQLYPK